MKGYLLIDMTAPRKLCQSFTIVTRACERALVIAAKRRRRLREVCNSLVQKLPER